MYRAYFWEILIDASNRLGPGGQNFSKVSASLIVYGKLGSEQTFMNFQVISFHSARTGTAKKSSGINSQKSSVCWLYTVNWAVIWLLRTSTFPHSVNRRCEEIIMQKFSKISCIVIVHIRLSIELHIENVYISLQRELVLRWNLLQTL